MRAEARGEEQVKTLEPAFNVVLGRVLLGTATPAPVAATLVPIMVKFHAPVALLPHFLRDSGLQCQTLHSGNSNYIHIIYMDSDVQGS